MRHKVNNGSDHAQPKHMQEFFFGITAGEVIRISYCVELSSDYAVS